MKPFKRYRPFESIRRYTYLLDISKPGLNGIRAPYEIRSFDNEIKLFLAFYPEIGVESYAVGAYYYLIKPCKEEKPSPILDKFFIDAQKTGEALHIKPFSGVTHISLDRLEFL